MSEQPKDSSVDAMKASTGAVMLSGSRLQDELMQDYLRKLDARTLAGFVVRANCGVESAAAKGDIETAQLLSYAIYGLSCIAVLASKKILDEHERRGEQG